jgi:tRNA(Ile)-lysidine synthase
MALDPGTVARFDGDWRALVGEGGDRALVALSGGPDSTALLLLLHASIGDRCVAATVDHGLRAEAREEAEQAAAVCRELGIAHATLTGDLPVRAGGTANVHARARALRYRLLREHAAGIGAAWIATGHHADDQLETVLMRLNRGAGVGGLSGVRAMSGAIVRPLLGWRRAELHAIVAAAGISAVADPSNTDDRFARAALRKGLGQIDWLDASAASRSATALAEADAALDWAADTAAASRCRFDEGGALLVPADLPAELCRRLAVRCLSHLDPAIVVRGPDLTRLLTTLSGGGTATLGGVLCASDGTIWTFRAAPPRRSL